MKIIILDDHFSMLKTLSEIVKSEFPTDAVFEFSNFKDSQIFIKNEDEIRFVLTDLRMDSANRMDMVDLCLELRIPCIIYSGYITKGFVQEAIRKGVVGFVSKTSVIEELVNALRNYCIVEPYLCPVLTKIIENTNELSSETQKPIFTDKELELMDCLCTGKSMEECADSMNLSLHTLRGYRKNMLVTNKVSFALLLKLYIEWYK